MGERNVQKGLNSLHRLAIGLVSFGLASSGLTLASAAQPHPAVTSDRPPAAKTGHQLPVGEDYGDSALSPFYRWERALPSKSGQLLRLEGLPATHVPRQAAKAFRLLYSSDDWRWKSGQVPVSGALYIPHGKAPKAGWPLVIWSHGTLGVADVCAPSWTGSNQRDRNYIARWLDDGFAVVAPDYQGLGGPGPHPYLLWQAEGRSVLDAGRAALQAGQQIANSVVITGQSQGSGAALGAARLAATYAPELKVKGTIATALVSTLPDGSIPQAAEAIGGAPYYTVYRMMSGSLPDGSPGPDSLLTDKGRLLLAAARTRCDPRVVSQANAITMDNSFTRPIAEIEGMMGVTGAMSPFRTRFPLMLGVGLGDELISPERQKRAVKAICRSGNIVRFRGYPGVRHGDTLTVSANDAVQFARDVLAGRIVETDCRDVGA